MTFDPSSQPSERGVVHYLLRHVTIVFLAFLAIGMPLPILPLFVHDTLGFGATAVGWIIGNPIVRDDIDASSRGRVR